MISLEIKVPPSVAGYPEAISRALPEIAEAVRGDIVSMAQRELKSTSQDYEQSVQLTTKRVSARQLGSGAQEFASIELTGGFMVQAVERGWAPLGSEGAYDMWNALLNGRSSKESKDKDGNVTGRYAVVPFRHQKPGGAGRTGAPMGSAEARAGMSRTQSELLGKAIHAAASKLKPTLSHPATATHVRGGRLAAGVGGAKPLKKKHTTDPYAGMIRQQKTYRSTSQSSYVTFRTVSSKVPGKWQHPGIKKHDFFGKAAKRLPRHVDLAIKHILRGMSR